MGFDYAAKIRTMLAMADSHEAEGNDGLAANIRAQVEVLMRKWKVEQEDMIAADPGSELPTHRIIDIDYRAYEIASYYTTVASLIAQHTGCRMTTGHRGNGYRFTVVGYENDLQYFEFLTVSAMLMFATRIDPKWDTEKSDEENIYLMRQAGIKRREIADKAWGHGAGNEAKNRSRVQRIYAAEAKRRGENVAAAGLGFQADDYRRAYAQAFTDRLGRRLREARDAADSQGGVVVLAGRSDRIDEAFYTLFPNLRPSTEVAEPYVAPNANCAACKKAKSGFCRDHNWLKPRGWSQADERRWQNQVNGASARAGREGGRAAADGVLLRGMASSKAQRVEASNKALEG